MQAVAFWVCQLAGGAGNLFHLMVLVLGKCFRFWLWCVARQFSGWLCFLGSMFVLPEHRKKVYDGREGSRRQLASLQVYAQHSVQRIFGSQRLRAAFFWLRVFSTSQTESQPAQNPLTRAVGLFSQGQGLSSGGAGDQRLRIRQVQRRRPSSPAHAHPSRSGDFQAWSPVRTGAGMRPIRRRSSQSGRPGQRLSPGSVRRHCFRRGRLRSKAHLTVRPVGGFARSGQGSAAHARIQSVSGVACAVGGGYRLGQFRISRRSFQRSQRWSAAHASFGPLAPVVALPNTGMQPICSAGASQTADADRWAHSKQRNT